MNVRLMLPRAILGACAIASGCAQAVVLSATGVGQALIYPYYTVNKSQDTYLSISNAGYMGVVAKINILEGHAGRPALDLVVYLAGHDNWSAVITQASDGGGAVLRTMDRSCTTPAIPAAGLPFTSAGFDGSGGLPADGGPADITRTREGSIEVIAGGGVIGGTPTARAMTPGDSGVPPGCASLPGSMTEDIIGPGVLHEGGWTGDSLYGYAAIINVGEGIYYPYDATAIGDFSDVPLFTATTGPLEPSLAQANSAEASTPGGAIAYFSVADAFPMREAVYEAEFEHGIDAVSALFMAHSMANDFLVAPALGAASDWVIQYPTLRFYRDPIHWNEGFSGGSFPTRGEVAVRDPDGRSILPDASDATRDDVELPYNVNVIGLSRGQGGAVSPVFGSRLGIHLDPATDAGTMELHVYAHRDGSELVLAGGGGVDSSAGYLWGAPVTGFMAYNIINANAQPGRLANYGGTFAHRPAACMRLATIYSRGCPTF